MKNDGRRNEKWRDDSSSISSSISSSSLYIYTHTQTNTHAQKRLRLFVYYLFFYNFFHWNSDLSDYLNATLHINQKLMIIFLKSQNLIAKFIKFGGKNFASVFEWLVFAYRIWKFYKKFLGLHTHIYISISI